MDSKHQAKNVSHGKRKEEHLQISLNEHVEFKGVTTGFEEYRFVHQALPEINLTDVDLSTVLFGKSLAAPIIISSMVGGIEAATRINRNLAQAAQALGLAMGVGSERCLVDEPGTGGTYQVRDIAPDILLFANLGAVQLNYGYGVKECLRVVEAIGADALILHLNPLQEALQPEGNTNFAGLLNKIRLLCRELPFPVIIKEVGGGISEEVARKLAEAGVAGIDVAGAGGTCWSEIEKRRTTGRLANNVSEAFASWGIPTAESVMMARRGAPELPLIAGGGIRTGIDVAKAIALGADAAGIAAPLLKAANHSPEAVEESLKETIETLRIAMFCIGTANISGLKFSPSLRKR
ncbi:MAG: type 2 isopentenyl-diphosphate Delta-isomerase [Dehalococcoidia bacterium]|nr:type 2 isopentenyl-diphosphate Delta-isomerase [Dehalococcoidia bacterium]